VLVQNSVGARVGCCGRRPGAAIWVSTWTARDLRVHFHETGARGRKVCRSARDQGVHSADVSAARRSYLG